MDQRDILTNAAKIEYTISQISEKADRIEEATEEKATCLANYEREIAVTILKLKNGAIMEFEGQPIKSLAANLIPIVAKGICYKESFDKEMAEGNYKGLITIIEALKAQLNGYQSLNKTMQ